jgi:hypothetical protein
MKNLTHLPNSKQRNKGFWKVTRYPNGDFTIGKNQPIKRDDGFKPLDGVASHQTFYGATKVSVPARQPDHQPDPSRLERIALDFEKAGNQELADFFGDRYAQEVLSGRHVIDIQNNLVIDGDDWGNTNLGLSDATNSHKSPSKKIKKSQKRGSKGITARGKRMVKNACYLLERDHGRHNLSFLTATLPAFASPDELKLICANWSELVRQLVQELKRILRRGGYCDDMVYITEIQEDRYANRGEVAPHLHLVMVGKKHRYQKHYAVEKAEMRSLWERLLSNFLGRPVTAAAATRLERPKKSLQGELGSYLSKGGKMIAQIIEDGKGDQLPSSYWGASQNLKNQIKSETKVVTGRDAQKFVDNLNDLHEAGLVYFKPIFWTIPDTNIQVTIGFVGWIRDIEVVSQFLAA